MLTRKAALLFFLLCIAFISVSQDKKGLKRKNYLDKDRVTSILINPQTDLLKGPKAKNTPNWKRDIIATNEVVSQPVERKGLRRKGAYTRAKR